MGKISFKPWEGPCRWLGLSNCTSGLLAQCSISRGFVEILIRRFHYCERFRSHLSVTGRYRPACRMYDLDGVALSGSLLTSLLNEAASPYAGPEQRQGTRYTDGLLFGSVIKRLGTETHDTHEQRSTTHREAVLSGYVRSPERCGFYDAFGMVDEKRLAALVPPGERLAGLFVVRKGGSTRPSLREMEVFRNLALSPLTKGQPPVLLVACLRLREGAPTHVFQYQCMAVQGDTEDGLQPGRVEKVSCRIGNLTMDSAAEYSTVRPAALGPLGMGASQQSALEEAFGAVLPPHVCEAEALLDTGMETMEALVTELKAVENKVVRLQLENRCMERVILSRRDV